MKKTLIFALALMAAPAVLAQSKAGRNGGKFLDVGVGAREVGLGASATALTGDATQAFWNPAGTALQGTETLSASLFYGDWIADLKHTAAAVGYSFGNSGTVTLGIQTFGVSDIAANRQNGYSDPFLQGLVTDQNTSETYSYMDLAVSATYARYFFDRLALGATVKMVSESIDGEKASATAFDFGSVYKLGFGGAQLAARLSNLGTAMTFYNQKNPLPLTFSIGTSFYPINTQQARLMLAVDTSKPQDNNQRITGGAEVSFYDLLFLRGGYKWGYTGAQDDGTSERPAIDYTVERYSLGGGIQYAMSGYNLAFDYAYTKMDLVDNVHRLTLRISR
ncbi:MAG TPA: PorV/PorQ family protein [Rhodothermales bacterium]|nr:PorV/PorQ family protein [Rhodothermales bacterium]